MAKSLSELDGAYWKGLKAGAGITNTPTLKALFTSTASVGSAIDVFRAARVHWLNAAQGGMTDTDLKKYESALKKLRDAFKKFEADKEFKSTNAQNLRTAIGGWQAEITEQLGLANGAWSKYEKEMKQAAAAATKKACAGLI